MVAIGQFYMNRDYVEMIRALPAEERLAMYEAVCSYALDEIEPEQPFYGLSEMVYKNIRKFIEIGARKYRQDTANGMKGGRPRGSRKVNPDIQTDEPQE